MNQRYLTQLCFSLHWPFSNDNGSGSATARPFRMPALYTPSSQQRRSGVQRDFALADQRVSISAPPAVTQHYPELQCCATMCLATGRRPTSRASFACSHASKGSGTEMGVYNDSDCPSLSMRRVFVGGRTWRGSPDSFRMVDSSQDQEVREVTRYVADPTDVLRW